MDAPQAIPLLTGLETSAVIANKGYESNKIVAFMQSTGSTAVIPPKSNRKDPWEYDKELYRGAQPDRTGLRQAEALEKNRHKVRPAGASTLPVSPVSGRFSHLGLVIVD